MQHVLLEENFNFMVFLALKVPEMTLNMAFSKDAF